MMVVASSLDECSPIRLVCLHAQYSAADLAYTLQEQNRCLESFRIIIKMRLYEMQLMNKQATALRPHTNVQPRAAFHKAGKEALSHDDCFLHNHHLIRQLWSGVPVLCPPHCCCPCEHDSTNPRAYPPPTFWIQIRFGWTKVGACAGRRCAATAVGLVLRPRRLNFRTNRFLQMLCVVAGRRYLGSPYTGVARHPFIALCGQVYFFDQFAEARFVQQPPMKAQGLGITRSVCQRH